MRGGRMRWWLVVGGVLVVGVRGERVKGVEKEK